MAIARGVGPVKNSGNNLTSISVTLVGTTAGNGIVIGAIWHDSSSAHDPTSVTVSGEANATAIGLPVRSSAVGDSMQIFELKNITTGGDKTITANYPSPGINLSIVAVEYSGQDSTTFLDASATGSGKSANPSISLTTGIANAMIFSIVGSNKAEPAPGTGYTRISVNNISWWTEGEDMLDAGAIGAKTVDYGVTGVGDWLIAAASFRPAGGGSPPASTFHSGLMMMGAGIG